MDLSGVAVDMAQVCTKVQGTRNVQSLLWCVSFMMGLDVTMHNSWLCLDFCYPYTNKLDGVIQRAPQGPKPVQ